MKLNMSKRVAEKKSDAAKNRREGLIPAIIYVQGKPSEPITVEVNEFNALLRKVESGHLSTTIFTLMDEKKQRKAIIKEIQYNITTYDVIHLDFEELHDDVKVSLKVPIEIVGQAESAGVKLGGAVRQTLRYLRVRCLPKNIPHSFQLDVRELGINQSLRLSDIELPETVTALANLNTVAVVMGKK